MIDYEIVDGICSHCGRFADWIPLEGVDIHGNPLDGYSICLACESDNEDSEMGIIEDDNLNVYF
jgi:hypothetical protein